MASDTAAAKIGVVTVTYNGAPYLDPFLRDCWKQTHSDFVLYVLDNHSQDETLQILGKQEDPRLRVIPKETNYGFAEGSNIGIRQALADGCTHILLLNNDIEFPESMFEVLLAELTQLGGAMIAPKIYFFDRPNCFWSAGATFARLRGWGAIHHGEGDADTGQFEQTRLVENTPGCCILIDSGLLRRIGLLDPYYFVYFEDTDFCLRAYRAQEKLYYTPKTHLFHKVSSATGGTDSPFSLKMYSRNKVYFVFKNFGLLGVPWIAAYLGYILYKGLTGHRGGLSSMFARLASFKEGLLLAAAHSNRQSSESSSTPPQTP